MDECACMCMLQASFVGRKDARDQRALASVRYPEATLQDKHEE